MNYKFSNLSKNERDYLEMILLDEMDVQAWFSISFSTMMAQEVFICIQ